MNPEGLAAFYAALNFSTALITFVLSLFISRKQGWTNALTFTLLLWAATLHSLTNGFLIVSKSPEIANLIENFRWFSLAAIPPLLLIFILDFTGRSQWLMPGWLVFYFAIPLITQIVVWTNKFHHSMVQAGYNEFIQIGTYLLPGERVFGTWFWVYAIWGYVLILATLLILIHDTFTTPQLEWVQFIWLFVGFIVPIVFSGVDTLKLLEPTWFKLVPIGFALMSITFFLAIIRGQFINIIPVARSYLIETLQDAVIMLDRNHQITDINPAASLLIGKKKGNILGKPAREILYFWPDLMNVFRKQNEVSTVVKVVQDTEGRSYDSHITPLRTRQKESSGWVIVLHDITQLKEAETRARQLAAVIEQAQETIVITDVDGSITYANPYFEETTGFSVKEALGKNPRILQSGRQDKSFYAQLWETIKGGEAWGGNFINKRKDGSFYHEAATIFPIKDSEGETINYAAVKRDITAQVKAEEALRDFSEKLEILHEISLNLSQTKTFDELTHLAVTLWREHLQFDRIGIWFVDLENPNFIQGSFGIDEHGIIRDERDQRMEIDADPIHNLLLENSTRLHYNSADTLRNHKAEIIGMGETAASALWDGKKIIGYIAIDNLLTQQPITSRQRELLVLFAQTLGNLASRIRSEESIQESERQYRLLADNATDAIWTMDMDWKFIYISPAVEQMRGFTPEEVLQQSLKEVLTPESLLIANKALTNLEQNIREEETIYPLTLELEQKCKDGTTILTESMISVVFNEDRQGYRLLGVTRDITERKKTEREIQRYARYQQLLNEITQAAIQQTDFEEMLQALADRMGDLLNADGCYITLWDEKTQTVSPAAAFGPLRDNYRTSVKPQPGEPTLTESVLTHEDVIVIENVFETPYLSLRIASQFPARSGIALPLIANNQKLGAALIAFNYERKYSQFEVDISKQAAQQIALAILKTRLFEEAEQRAKEAETLRLAGTAIVTTLEREQAIERILEELSRVVPYDSASVLLVHDTEMEIVGARGFKNPEQILKIRFQLTDDTPNKVIFETRKPYILYDAQKTYPTFQQSPHNHIHGWMGIPLLIREQLIGMLALDSHNPGQFKQDHARFASAFADQVAIALENIRLFEETRRLAIIDSLTNLFNRRHFMELARREFERSKRYKVPLSIIMLDIDHFKNINDTFGHLVGDQVLQTAAFICRKNLRSIDFIGRFGGEEFIILLPETALLDSPKKTHKTDSAETLPAQTVAERIRQTMEMQTFEIGENSIKITVSMGVAELKQADKSIDNVINSADQALLQAKNQGRNRISIWDPEENLAQD